MTTPAIFPSRQTPPGLSFPGSIGTGSPLFSVFLGSRNDCQFSVVPANKNTTDPCKQSQVSHCKFLLAITSCRLPARMCTTWRMSLASRTAAAPRPPCQATYRRALQRPPLAPQAQSRVRQRRRRTPYAVLPPVPLELSQARCGLLRDGVSFGKAEMRLVKVMSARHTLEQ